MSAPTIVAPSSQQQFESAPPWQHLIEQQITAANIEGESEITLDLLHYIHDSMSRARSAGSHCTVTLRRFQIHEATHYGISPSACADAWNTLDWRHAMPQPCK